MRDTNQSTFYREYRKDINKINNCSLCGNLCIEWHPDYCLNTLCKNFTRPRVLKEFQDVIILDKSLHWSFFQKKDISIYEKIGTVLHYSNAEDSWYCCRVLIHNQEDHYRSESFLVDDKLLNPKQLQQLSFYDILQENR